MKQSLSDTVRPAADLSRSLRSFILRPASLIFLCLLPLQAQDVASLANREIVRRQALPGYRLCIERGFRGAERLEFVAIPRDPFNQRPVGASGDKL